MPTFKALSVPSLGLLLALVATAVVGSALPPTPFHRQAVTKPGSFVLQASRRSTPVSGDMAYAVAVAKWSADRRPEVLGARLRSITGQEDDQSGYAAVRSAYRDLIFVVDVGIGTPPQRLSLIIDTGSPDFWVISPDRSWTRYQGYNPDISLTSKKLDNSSFSIGYLDGSFARGPVYTDDLLLGESYTLENMTFGLATSYDWLTHMLSEINGLMGLSRKVPTTIQPPQPTLLDLLAEELDEHVFTVDMRSNSLHGTFEFGHIDNTSYTGDIGWVDSPLGDLHWKFHVQSARVGDGEPFETDFWALPDTGTTLLLLPADLVARYYNQVPTAWTVGESGSSDAAWLFPCDVELPDFELILDSEYKIVIPGRFIRYKEDYRGQQNQCYGGLQSSDGLGSGAIAGAILLKSQFLAFDFRDNRIGFANKDLSPGR